MIRTQRLVLRRAVQHDLDDLHSVLSHPRAMRYFDRPPHRNRAQTQRFLDGLIASDGRRCDDFVVVFNGHCVGKAGFWRKAEMGYILHPDVWGQGLAQEALSALIPHAFENWPDVSQITAECDPRNDASLRLLRRQSFRQTGFASRNFLYGETEWCDTVYLVRDRI